MSIKRESVSTIYRIAAYLADNLIIAVASKMIGNLIYHNDTNNKLIHAVLLPIYFIGFEKTGTLGKKAFGLIMLNNDLEYPSLKIAISRVFLKGLLYLSIGFLVIGYYNDKFDNISNLFYVLGGIYVSINLYCFLNYDKRLIHDIATKTSIYKMVKSDSLIW